MSKSETSGAGFTVLIPARLASSRLPDKPLADIAGLPMVVRVAQRAQLSAARRCVVACDDQRVLKACASHGVEAVLTRADHVSGSDRLAEACELLGLDGDEVVVNVQGDEPLIEPSLVDAVATELVRRSDCAMSTAAHAIDRVEEFLNPNVVKVVVDRMGTALYFSRAPMPWWRDGMADLSSGRVPAKLPSPAPLRHVGLYAYRAGFLRGFPELEPAPLEVTESLEQLRVLWHGQRIAVHVTPLTPGPGVDTPLDLERVRKLLVAGA
ncbi:3-deoxy-manno-octulosonate cytidylyltransferase [Hydrogenophaga sp.]|uniref:3-deoxy-manno-octulosonate cytidylyltransferase n=1 Tax=Hydrogenophaga sp. TaxID=1904254 RepID=UPI00260EA3E1|nr:3-deoxy-manno-octulosonate cytidylyltransferase [Hydrogenophaga sp.]MCW5652324.1 3-deoxy-manno-octulosonate cytidylyltransferase [Hydrogenophaga sp.]